MKIKRKRLLGIPIFLAVFAAGAALVMLLWNWIVPGVIGWAAISFWKAAGLLLLSKLLFGGFGRFRGPHMFGGHPHHSDIPMGIMRDERNKIHEKVKNMSAEERREYIRSHMFGGGHIHSHDGDK